MLIYKGSIQILSSLSGISRRRFISSAKARTQSAQGSREGGRGGGDGARKRDISREKLGIQWNLDLTILYLTKSSI